MSARNLSPVGTLSFIACLSFAGLPFQSHAQDKVFEIEPGLWEFTDAFAIPQMRIDDRTTRKACISKSEARRSLQQIVESMTGGEGSNCSVSNISEGSGEISLDVQCASNQGGIQMKSAGHMKYLYSRSEYSGEATGSITLQGQDLPYTGHGSGRRLGDC